MGKRVIMLGIAILFAAVLAISTASAEVTLHFVPEDSSQPDGYCHNVTVEAWANITSDDTLLSGQFAIHHNDTCLDVVDHPVYGDPHGWGPEILPSWSSWNANPNCHGEGYEMIMFTFNSPKSGTDVKIFNVTFHCNCTEYFVSPLNFSRGKASFGCPIEILNATDYNLYPDNTTLDNGTISCGTPSPINVDIRADGIAGNIFDVTSYPVNPGTVTEDGVTINNQTAMGALVAYCQDNGINVDITMGYYGEYVIQIGTDPADYNNWMYVVDEVVPGIGGAQYSLSGGEFVHWFNYMLNYYTVLTTLNTSLINAGDYLNATVTWKNTTGTYPLNGAEVFVSDTAYVPGSSVETTGTDGNCTFQWSTPGTWYVYAVHPTYGSGLYNYPPVSFTCLVTQETYTKALVAGWNQISLPLTNTTNMTVANIMGAVSGSYDALYRYDATTRSWVAMSSSATMANGVGYFIHMTQAATWTYTGSAAYTSMNVPLGQGLNMVGWLNCSKPISDALSSIEDKYRYVARWNATSRKFETYVPNAPPAFNKFTTMDRGEGYFISMKEAATLTESCP